METIMRKTTVTILTCTILLLAGCAAFTHGSPPTKAEQAVFDVTTNYTPEIQVKTNIIPVLVYRTNEIPVVHTIGVNQYQTNIQLVTVPVTNYVQRTELVTNQVANYTYTPNATLTGAQGIISAVPVYGGLAGTAFGLIASVWGWARSAKKGATGASLAQGIETMREFVKQLPNGAAYDNALTTWLQQHQNETGTAQEVLALLKKSVNNEDAQVAADQVMKAIAALNPAAVPQTANIVNPGFVVPPSPTKA